MGTQKSRRGWLIGLSIAAVALVGGGVYLAGYLAAGDTVPRNASVAGIPLGGLSSQEAVAKLRSELTGPATAPMDLTVGDRSATVQPAEAGLSIDYQRTVAETGVGRSAHPSNIIRVLTGGTDTEPVITVDQDTLATATADASAKLDQKAKDATIKYDVPSEGAPKIATTPGTPSITVDQNEAAREVQQAYLTTTSVPVDARIEDPKIPTAEVDKVAKDWAEPAISAPITVKTSKGQFKITERAIAKSAKFEVVDGTTIKPVIDAKQLRNQASPQIDKSLRLNKPKDASFKFSGGRPTVVPAVVGEDIPVDKLYAAAEPVVTKSDGRTIEVPVERAEPKLSTDAANKLGVKEVVGQFTTEFPHADYRNTNIGQVASVLTGDLIQPDETFSFNESVGQRTTENGFVDGNIIDNGRLRMETGGGASQAVTTLYNAGFFSGMVDAEHWAHTLYFDRYPAGREATVAGASKDLKIKNDTPYGVVIEGVIKKSSPGKKGSITFKMWSTSYYEVKTAEPKKSDFYQESPISDSSPSCSPQSASPGFTATYWRERYRDGKLVGSREQYSWRYNSMREIKCT